MPAKKSSDKKTKSTSKPTKKPETEAQKKAIKSDKSLQKTRIKVIELAKELQQDVKNVMGMLKDLGIPVKSAASSIEEEFAKIVKDVAKPAPPPKPKPVPPKPAPSKPVTQKPSEPKPVQPKPPVPKPVAPKPVPAIPKPKPEFKAPPPPPEEKKKAEPVKLEGFDISIGDLAEKASIKPSELIKELMKKGKLLTINQRISIESAKEILSNLGKEAIIKEAPAQAGPITAKVKAENLVLRPPVVTILGHVDHGKTKLLDAIRKTRVAEGEAGGITQHIGAYQITVHGKKVTFLDTPGHEAFTSLRARGAKVTDVAVLVVAADDGVMPQTIEALDHAKAAGVPIIVAINKIDKPEANPDRVKKQLSELGLIPEEWGGSTVMVHTSARQEQGINDLLEMILLVAEIQDLKADPDGTPTGIVIESRLDKGRGPVADLLVKTGTLKIGQVFTIGATYGKIRALFSDRGERLKEAGPSTPVEVLGAIDVPNAGDILEVVSSEKIAREIAEKKKEQQSLAVRGKVLSLEDFSKHIKEGEKVDLAIVIKADAQGSIDAISQSLKDLVVGNIHTNIMHKAVGAINESDIMLARASDAIVFGFNVNFDGNAEDLSTKEGVEVRRYNIIYKLLDDVKLAMEGLLEPEYEEVVVGHAEVRQLFKYSKVGVIAGCFVKDGKMTRGGMIRVLRDGKKVFEGKLESLKRFKEDVRSVEQNFECGISLTDYNDFIVGDIIEAFEIREKTKGK